MELQLGLGLPGCCYHDGVDLFASKKRKRDGGNFDGVGSGFDVLRTLPLLWTEGDHEGSGGNDDDQLDASSITDANKNDGEETGVVGWPPVNSWRRKLRHQKSGGGGSSSKSTFVKVTMEGVGIGRKVDLGQYQSYQELTQALLDMFGKGHENVELTYQDKEGDWLLAGDVPWGTFLETVQRLKLIKNVG